jgi:hypothetical protein
MKKTTLLLVFGLCFGISGLAQGSSKEAEDFYKFYSYYQGKWQVEQEADGKKESVELHCSGYRRLQIQLPAKGRPRSGQQSGATTRKQGSGLAWDR